VRKGKMRERVTLKKQKEIKRKEMGKEERTDELAKVKNHETRQGIKHTLNPSAKNEGHLCIC
jgi:hypothetical protein